MLKSMFQYLRRHSKELTAGATPSSTNQPPMGVWAHPGHLLVLVILALRVTAGRVRPDGDGLARFTTPTAMPSDPQRTLTGYYWTLPSAPGWRCALPPSPRS